MADVDGNSIWDDVHNVRWVPDNPDVELIERLRLQLNDAEIRAAKAQGKYEAYAKINKELLDLLFNPPSLSMFELDGTQHGSY